MKCYDLEDSASDLDGGGAGGAGGPPEHTLSEDGVQRWSSGTTLEEEEHIKQILELRREICCSSAHNKKGGSSNSSSPNARDVKQQQMRMQLKLLQNKRKLFRRSKSHLDFTENVRIVYHIPTLACSSPAV